MDNPQNLLTLRERTPQEAHNSWRQHLSLLCLKHCSSCVLWGHGIRRRHRAQSGQAEAQCQHHPWLSATSSRLTSKALQQYHQAQSCWDLIQPLTRHTHGHRLRDVPSVPMEQPGTPAPRPPGCDPSTRSARAYILFSLFQALATEIYYDVKR